MAIGLMSHPRRTLKNLFINSQPRSGVPVVALSSLIESKLQRIGPYIGLMT